MGDINRSGSHELIEANIELKIQYYEIQLNEKINQIKQLDATLDKMKSVEIKRVELAKALAKKEIVQIQSDLQQLRVKEKAIDVKKSK